jgi:hypothetical protein
MASTAHHVTHQIQKRQPKIFSLSLDLQSEFFIILHLFSIHLSSFCNFIPLFLYVYLPISAFWNICISASWPRSTSLALCASHTMSIKLSAYLLAASPPFSFRAFRLLCLSLPLCLSECPFSYLPLFYSCLSIHHPPLFLPSFLRSLVFQLFGQRAHLILEQVAMANVQRGWTEEKL